MAMRWIKITLVMLGLIMAVALSGCGNDAPVKVAVMTKLDTGSIVGISEVDGARFFLEQNNIQNIEIIPFDDAWDPEKTKEVYQEIRAQGIDIIVTSHTSTCSLALKELVDAEGDEVLIFNTGATSDKLSGQDDMFIRNVVDVHTEQRFIAEAINAAAWPKLLIVRDIDNAGYVDPALTYFKQYYRAPVQVLDVSMKKMQMEELRSQLTASGFQSLYLLVGGYQTNAGAVAQLARTLVPDCPIMYTPWLKTPTIIETAGTSLSGSLMPAHYPPRGTDAAIDAYVDAFKNRYGYSPTFISLNVYQAIEILQQGLDAGLRSPAELKQFVLEQDSIETTFGKISFDEYGDSQSPLYFITDIAKEF